MGHKAFTVMALHSGGRGHGGGGVCLSCETDGSVDTALDPSGQLSSSFQSGDTHGASEREVVVIPRSMLQTIPIGVVVIPRSMLQNIPRGVVVIPRSMLQNILIGVVVIPRSMLQNIPIGIVVIPRTMLQTEPRAVFVIPRSMLQTIPERGQLLLFPGVSQASYSHCSLFCNGLCAPIRRNSI